MVAMGFEEVMGRKEVTVEPAVYSAGPVEAQAVVWAAKVALLAALMADTWVGAAASRVGAVGLVAKGPENHSRGTTQSIPATGIALRQH